MIGTLEVTPKMQHKIQDGIRIKPTITSIKVKGLFFNDMIYSINLLFSDSFVNYGYNTPSSPAQSSYSNYYAQQPNMFIPTIPAEQGF
jgi:hypothetical protein